VGPFSLIVLVEKPFLPFAGPVISPGLIVWEMRDCYLL
jgi:hypothetical protein